MVSGLVRNLSSSRSKVLAAIVFFLSVVQLFPQNRGTFQAGINYAAGGAGGPQIAVTDVNGDGKPDLISVARCSSPVSCEFGDVLVHLNDGHGGFGPAIKTRINGPVDTFAVGDLNGDGKADVVLSRDCSGVGCSSSGLVLLGNGDGIFSPVSMFAYRTVAGDDYMAVGDFNGDGKLDVVGTSPCTVLSGCSQGTINVYLGNGDGTLQPANSYLTVGNNALPIAMGDLNGDGRLDIVVGIQQASGGLPHSGFTLLINNGNGTFTESIVNLPFYGMGAVATGDFDSDGRLDVAIASSSGTAIAFGNGDGTFRLPSAFTATEGFSPAQSMVVVDMNLDGKPDLVVSGQSGFVNHTALLLNDGNGNFRPGNMYALGGWNTVSVASADFNGDGLPDVAVASACAENDKTPCVDGTISILLGNGDGSARATRVVTASNLGNRLSPVEVGDFNGDGVSDIVVIADILPGSGGFYLVPGLPDGSQGPPVLFVAPIGEPLATTVADFNGDGKLDVALSSACKAVRDCSQSAISIFLGTGGGSFLAPVIHTVGTSLNLLSRSIVAGDFNGDGKIDLAVAGCATINGCTQNSISVLIGNGDGTFQSSIETSLQSSSLNSYPTIAAADLNSDGKTDLVSLSATGDSRDSASLVSVFLSNGDGHFTLNNSFRTRGSGTNFGYASGNDSFGIAIGDVNKDGTPDLVVANYCDSGAAYIGNVINFCPSGSVEVFFGGANGTFQNGPVTVVPDANFLSASIADVDADGIPDVIASSLTGAVVLLGNEDGTFKVPVVYSSASNFQSIHAVVIDVNGDGAPDIVQPAADSNVYILLNRGGTFIASQSSTGSSAAGQPVTFTTTVTPSIAKSLAPGGTVDFFDELVTSGPKKAGSKLLGNAPLVNGVATLTTSGLLPGNHSITPRYFGDTNFNPHDGSALAHFVEDATATTTSLASSVNPANWGQTITLIATASATSGTPSGTVTFSDSGVTIGSAIVNSSGQATFDISSLLPGTHSIVAGYAGSNGYAGSASAAMSQVVAPAQIVSQVNPTIYGLATPLSISAPLPGSKVTFLDGSVVLGTVVADQLGTATLTHTFLEVGTHPISAVLAKDSVSSNSSVLDLVVNQSITHTSFSPLPISPINFGETPLIAANVMVGPFPVGSSVSGDQPTGTVRLLDGNTVIAIQTLPQPGSIQFQLKAASLTAGAHSFSAVYNGDQNYLGSSSNSFTEIVNRAATTTSVSSSPNPSVAGAPVTFTAQVPQPFTTGMVQFVIDGFPLGEPVSGSGKSVVASITTTGLNVGNHTVTATYSGDANNFGSSATLAVGQVVQAPTVKLTLTPNIALNSTRNAYLVTLTLINSGNAPASGIQLTSESLNTAALVAIAVTDIPAGVSSNVILSFPVSAGPSGSSGVLRVNGKYAGGTFGGSFRVTLP